MPWCASPAHSDDVAALWHVREEILRRSLRRLRVDIGHGARGAVCGRDVIVTRVRAMFTTFPSRGHFFPLVPLAEAVQAAGHDVVVASGPAFREQVERRGFDFLAVGIDGPRASALYNERHPQALTLPAEEQAVLIVTRMFVEIWVPAVMSDLDRLVDWRPDVIIREEGEFAAPLVAAVAGVPCAEHSWGPIRPRSLAESTAAAMAPVWRSYGIEPDPLAGFYRWLYIDICPPSLQFPDAADVEVLHRLRPPTGATISVDDLPAWVAALGSRPVVYVTFGTVARYNQDPAFFAAAIEGLADLGADVVVTLGPTGDPAALGSQPSHVHVERFVPQAAILPHCRAVVTNGGSGSVIGALAHGAPLLCVPAGASPSQQRNADAVVRAGAGRSIGRTEATAARIRAEVSALLEDSSYRNVAQRLAAEIADMPPVAEGVTLLERLVKEQRPLTA